MRSKALVNLFMEKIIKMQRSGSDDPGSILDSLLIDYCAVNTNSSQPYINIINQFYFGNNDALLSEKIEFIDTALCKLPEYDRYDPHDSLWVAFFYFYPMTFQSANKKIKGVQYKENDEHHYLPESILKECWLVAYKLRQHKHKNYFNNLLDAINSPDFIICNKAIKTLRKSGILDAALIEKMGALLFAKMTDLRMDEVAKAKKTYRNYVGISNFVTIDDTYINIVMTLSKHQFQIPVDTLTAAFDILFERLSKDKPHRNAMMKKICKLVTLHPVFLEPIVDRLLAMAKSAEDLCWLLNFLEALSMESSDFSDTIFQALFQLIFKYIDTDKEDYAYLGYLVGALNKFKTNNSVLTMKKYWIEADIEKLAHEERIENSTAVFLTVVACLDASNVKLQRFLILYLCGHDDYPIELISLLIKHIHDHLFQAEILEQLRAAAVNPSNTSLISRANAVLMHVNVDAPTPSREFIALLRRTLEGLDQNNLQDKKNLIKVFSFLKIQDNTLMCEVIDYLIMKTSDHHHDIRRLATRVLGAIKLTNKMLTLKVIRALIVKTNDDDDQVRLVAVGCLGYLAQLNPTYLNEIQLAIAARFSDSSINVKNKSRFIYEKMLSQSMLAPSSEDGELTLAQLDSTIKAAQTNPDYFRNRANTTAILDQLSRFKLKQINLLPKFVDIWLIIFSQTDQSNVITAMCQIIVDLQISDTTLNNRIISALVGKFNEMKVDAAAKKSIVATLVSCNGNDYALKKNTIVILISEFSEKNRTQEHMVKTVNALCRLANDRESMLAISTGLLTSARLLDFNSVQLNYAFSVLEQITPHLSFKEKIQLTSRLDKELKSLRPNSELTIFMIALINKLEHSISNDDLLSYKVGMPEELTRTIIKLTP